jgi:hypothetical protein
MKTDDLIVALARRAEKVDPRSSTRRLALGAVFGVAAAVPLLGLLGLNPTLAADASTPMFWIKLTFVAGIAAASWQLVRRLAQPGAKVRPAGQALAVPLVAMATLAFFVLALARPDERMPLLMGSSWSSCPFSIALLAAPALGLLLVSVRSLAPTRCGSPAQWSGCLLVRSAHWFICCTAPSSRRRFSPSGMCSACRFRPPSVRWPDRACCIGSRRCASP